MQSIAHSYHPLLISFSKRYLSGGISRLLDSLRVLDTACLCDADRIVLRSNKDPSSVLSPISRYEGVRLMNGSVKPLMSFSQDHKDFGVGTMAGLARTVQCTRRNDILAVLRGLVEAEKDEVLVVNTSDSTNAVCGELFAIEALRRGIVGIVVDGPVRDSNRLRQLVGDKLRIYATSVIPYAGTEQSPGSVQIPVVCGGVSVHPGDIVVGDDDGMIVGSADTFTKLLPVAQKIYDIEAEIQERLLEGKSLETLTNYRDHIEARMAKEESSLEFRL